MQTDYILRLIERIGVLLATIRKLILAGGDPSEVSVRLQAVANEAGYDLQLLQTLDLESIVAVVAPGGEVDVARTWVLGELLLLSGLQASGLEDPEFSRAQLTKSRALFELLGTSASVTRHFPEARVRISEIDSELESMGPLPPGSGAEGGVPVGSRPLPRSGST